MSNQNCRDFIHRVSGIWRRGQKGQKQWPYWAGVVLTALIMAAASTVGIASANDSPKSTSRSIVQENARAKLLGPKHAKVAPAAAKVRTGAAVKSPVSKSLITRQHSVVAKSKQKSPKASALDQNSGFVDRNGTSLTLNGLPYKFVGINIYMAASGVTPASCDGDSYPPLNLNAILSDMPNGIVFRFWAFQDFFVSNGSLNWTSFDQVLAVAAAHGDKVIPVLANQYSYCDGTAKDLGWYQSGYEKTIGPGDVVPYLQYVSDAVSRYANNPTIALWQLVNEGEAVNSDGSCNESSALAALLAFSNNVGGLIHSIDPKNLVSLGTLAGFSGSGAQWCGAANVDFQTLMASPGNDICDFHDYGYPKDPMGIPFGPDLATAIQMCHADDKPLMVGETGIMASNSADLASRAAEFAAKFSAQFNAGSIGELMWTWANSPDYVSPVQNSAFPDYGVFPGDPALKVLKSFPSPRQ